MNRFIIADASKCIGCRTCEVACVVSHQENQDCAALTPKTFLPRIHVIKGVNVSTATACRQCEDAPCANVCPRHVRLVRNLLTLCSEKNLQLSRRVLHTSPKSIRKRLLSYFSECIKRTGSYEFDIPYNRQQLADYLNVERSALSRELSYMKRDGIIDYHKNTFRLI